MRGLRGVAWACALKEAGFEEPECRQGLAIAREAEIWHGTVGPKKRATNGIAASLLSNGAGC